MGSLEISAWIDALWLDGPALQYTAGGNPDWNAHKSFPPGSSDAAKQPWARAFHLWVVENPSLPDLSLLQSVSA